jgi:hypothetical protein
MRRSLIGDHLRERFNGFRLGGAHGVAVLILKPLPDITGDKPFALAHRQEGVLR